MKKKTIDVTDIEILNILAGHAEINNKELANKIGLSEGPTLVRVQNFRERGIIKSYKAHINLEFFGYSKLYLMRLEVTDTNADEMKQRLLLSRFIIIYFELEGSIDLVMRIYLAIYLTKNLKAAKDELHFLTAGLKGIRTVTFNPISSMEQRSLLLDNKDVIK
jgi:Lrp/AsnC family transcriptional regulator, leucine-responsive regulatory protein